MTNFSTRKNMEIEKNPSKYSLQTLFEVTKTHVSIQLETGKLYFALYNSIYFAILNKMCSILAYFWAIWTIWLKSKKFPGNGHFSSRNFLVAISSFSISRREMCISTCIYFQILALCLLQFSKISDGLQNTFCLY